MIDRRRTAPHHLRVGRSKKKTVWNARGIDWEAVDWGPPGDRRPSTEIAAELGCSLSSVQKARIKLGVEQTSRTGRPSVGGESRSIRLPWAEIDAAAAEEGVSSPEFLRRLFRAYQTGR